MSDNIITLPISAATLRRFRRIKYPAIFEPRPVPVKKKPVRRKKGARGPTPSYGLDVLVIDSDGRRYPPTVHRQMVAAAVLEELLKRGDIRIDQTPPFGPYWKRRKEWVFMTDRMLKAAIIDTDTIIFCKHGQRHPGGKAHGPPRWLPPAVREAEYFWRRKKEEERKNADGVK